MKKRVSPCEIRRSVELIESHFDFPAWLEDLYNQCDWIETQTRWVEVPHLLEYLEEYLSRPEAEILEPVRDEAL